MDNPVLVIEKKTGVLPYRVSKTKYQAQFNVPPLSIRSFLSLFCCCKKTKQLLQQTKPSNR